MNLQSGRAGKTSHKSKHLFKSVHDPVKIYQDENKENKHCKSISSVSKETQTDDSWLDDLIQERQHLREKIDPASLEIEESAYDLMVKGDKYV